MSKIFLSSKTRVRALFIPLALACLGLPGTTFGSDAAPLRREWKVDGVTRDALVYAPSSATNKPTPVIFAFHGHGGTMQRAARMFDYQTQWPEAIVVYMQGLNTPGRLTDPEGKKPGWQKWQGDQDDRDLKFFDTVLASLKSDYRVDTNRVYATGHSNGGGFTYLLWAERADVFAAFAPSASAAGTRVQLKKAKPVLHLAAKNDPLVKYEWQEDTIERARSLNQCASGNPSGDRCTLYPSKVGAPVVTFLHLGAHAFPSEAPSLIVKFFKEHARP